MNTLITFFLEQANVGLMMGMVLAVLLVLYPVMKRLLSPQQRAWLWTGAWLYGLVCDPYNRGGIIPITFQDLVAPRTGRLLNSLPAFLPGKYTGPGPYHIALPGGALIRVELRHWAVCLLAAVWTAGMIALMCYFWYRSRRLVRLGRRGTLLEPDDPRLEGIARDDFLSDQAKVYLSPGLPASFVHRRFLGGRYGFYGYEIFLQEELAPGQMELVLLHEARHIRLWHCWWKVLGTCCLVKFWWDPLVWLAFRYFCRDIELACDESVMKRLSPERRKAYAKTLLELGTGRQMWDVPLAFGESDSALRIKKLTGWKKRRWYVLIPTWCLVCLMICFFRGGQYKMPPGRDVVLSWERQSSIVDFAQALGAEMGEANDQDAVEVAQVWEAPPQYPRSAFWVLDRQGQWYRVYYAWWGPGDHIGVLSTKQVERPDLTGCEQYF